MEVLGIGLIGCGGRMCSVTGMIQKAALEAGKRVEVVALCDPSEGSIAAARSTLQGADKASAYAEYRDLVTDPAVDWVMIGSWNCFHAEQSIAALDAGKHIFCEKPLALTIDECVAMRDAWKRSGTHFTIGFTLRYSPHYVRIKETIDSGAIGAILSMEFNETLEFNHGGYIHADWRRKTKWAGSHLLEKCCHDLDIVNWITGSLASRAASFGGCDFFTGANVHHVERLGKDRNGRLAFQTWSVPGTRGNILNPFNDDKDIVDNQVAIVEYANGVRSTFHTNCNAGIPERRLYICGTEGAIRADLVAGSVEMRRVGFDEKTVDLAAGVAGGHGGGDPILAKSVVATMFEGSVPKTSMNEGIAAAVTAFGIDRSMATGRVVNLADLWREAGVAPETM